MSGIVQGSSRHHATIPSQSGDTGFRHFSPQWIVLSGLFGFYLLMFLRYRPYDIDNPWFLSFSYNACIEHVGTDQFMEIKFPGGMDGTQYFGRIAAFLQCAVLNRTGWQQWPAMILSAVLIVAALGLWFIKLKKLGYGRTFVTVFLVGTGLSEPLLAAANRFRYESVSFFLLSLGLLLIASDSLFWGMLAGTLAIEVQPIALAGLIPLVVLASLTQKLRLREWLRLAAGGAASALIYLYLHANLFRSGLLPHLPAEAGGQVGGFVAAYFEDRIRHLPELIGFVIAAVAYWRKRHLIKSHYAAISALLILLFSFVISHGNPAYMIFLYPFLILASLSAFQVEENWRPALAIFLVYFLSQYAVLAYLNRGRGYRTADIRQVSDEIRTIARDRDIDDATLKIYGDYGLWFAHPRNYRAASVGTEDSIQDADLYLCFDHDMDIPAMRPVGMLFCPDILERVPLRRVQSLDVRGNTLYFYVR